MRSAPYASLFMLVLALLAGGLLPTLAPAQAASGQAALVKDFNTTPYQPGFSLQGDPVAAGATLFFSAADDVHGAELWASDGTAGSARVLKDIRIADGASEPRGITPFGTGVIFHADDGTHGREPWFSDGTAQGTRLLKDIAPGLADGLISDPSTRSQPFVVSGDLAFFSGRVGGVKQLWVSDGTPAGTRPFSYLPAGASLARAPYIHTFINGRVFYSIVNNADPNEALWVSDGTPAGTLKLLSVPADQSVSAFGEMERVGAQVFFRADARVWRSDGTAAGTIALTDPTIQASPIELHAANGAFFFSTRSAAGQQLWASDGTVASTRLVKEFSADLYHAQSVAAGRLFFQTFSQGGPHTLWVSDGTAAGTLALKTFAATLVAGDVTSFNGASFFVTGPSPRTLWRTDGTPAGTTALLTLPETTGKATLTALPTRLLVQLCNAESRDCRLWGSDGTAAGSAEIAGVAKVGNLGSAVVLGGAAYITSCASVCTLLRSDGTVAGTIPVQAGSGSEEFPVIAQTQSAGGKLFFSNTTGLWASDGTPTGTIGLYTPQGQASYAFAPVGQRLFATIKDGAGAALWLSDGTTAGTKRLMQAPAGAGLALPTPVGDRLFFLVATSSVGGWNFTYDLWVSDGTTAGTTAVAGQNNIDPTLTAFGKGVAFTRGKNLWVSDGTATGARLLKDLGSTILNLAAAGKTLFAFPECKNEERCVLWGSDGTAAGTRSIKEYASGACIPGKGGPDCASAQAWQFTPVGDRLFFTALDGQAQITDATLWASDGTTEGTVMLAGGSPDQIVAVGTRAFFVSADPAHGRELWVSNGTPQGTRMLTDIVPGTGEAALANLTGVAEQLFFTATDPQHGRELWQSDGTTGGTRMVQDIWAGAASSEPTNLTGSNGQVFFNAASPASGRELWVSDASGTRLVQEIGPATAGGDPQDVHAAGPHLFFSANDSSTGPALWTLPLTSQPLRGGRVGPFRRIEAEDFDLGGEGLAYHDAETANLGSAGRPGESVDIVSSQGITYLGYTQAGEWLNYSISAETSTTYSVKVSVAAQGTGGTFHLELDGVAVGSPVQVPDTGSWTSWRTLKLPDLQLSAGVHTLRLVLDANGSAKTVGNFDWIELADPNGHVVLLPQISR